MTIYGYARCSTDETKQNIDRQIKELKELGATKETIYLDRKQKNNRKTRNKVELK